MAMYLLMNTGGVAQTNCYLIADAESKQAVIFDAPDHTAGRLLDEAQRRGFDVIGLWLTHGHFDHIADHALVTERFPAAKVLIHRLDEPKLKRANVQGAMFDLPFVIPPRSADQYVEDGQGLSIGNARVQVIHTPGHAPGHVMYHLPSEKLLVGGDLIIAGSVGRTDLPDANHEQLNESIRKIMALPDDTTLLPGHGQPSRLADERRSNPFVQEALADRGAYK
jgi:hydroxyacylglutathione hydrolase